MDQYRVSVWSSVAQLWGAFGGQPEAPITAAFPQATDFVAASYRDKDEPEWVALQIVLQVIPAYVARSMTADDRREALAELQRVLQMDFAQANGFEARPFVALTVSGWQTAGRWAGEGNVPPDAAKTYLQAIVRALNAK